MTAGESIHFDSFHRIRDRALLLNLGRAYLCEPPFLIKYGTELEQSLEILRKDIQGLKKTFPGKFVREVDTDAILTDLHGLAAQLKNPERSVQEKCAAGELGRDLEERLGVLSEALKDLWGQVKGAPTEYSGKEALTGALHRAGGAVSGGLGILGKVLGVGFVVVALVFGYLFFTMEREEALEKRIAGNQEEVAALRQDLSQVSRKAASVELRIKELDRTGSTRQDKVQAMELSVKLEELEQQALVIRSRVEQHQRVIEEAERSLQELRHKSFLERLLRK